MIPSHNVRNLESRLWDLCAHTEAKLRYIRQAQEELEKYRRMHHAGGRLALQQDIVKTLDDITEITRTMHAIAREAGNVARALSRPEKA